METARRDAETDRRTDVILTTVTSTYTGVRAANYRVDYRCRVLRV